MCVATWPESLKLGEECFLKNIFKRFPLLVQVRSLLKLYADIEHTGRNQAFYEKFGCRQVVGEILGEASVLCFSSLRALLQGLIVHAIAFFFSCSPFLR